MILLDLYNVLVSVGIPVSHYEGELDCYPYIVYQEFSTFYSAASGKPYREKIRVEVSHFTKTEFDPTLELLKQKLLENNINFNMITAFNRDNKVITSQFELVITQDISKNEGQPL